MIIGLDIFFLGEIWSYEFLFLFIYLLNSERKKRNKIQHLKLHCRDVMSKSNSSNYLALRIWSGNYEGMFGNYFFPLFFVSKINFLFLTLKNLFGNLKWNKNKNYSQNSICEGSWKQAKNCFQSLVFKSQWKHTSDLMNLSHLMS